MPTRRNIYSWPAGRTRMVEYFEFFIDRMDTPIGELQIVAQCDRVL